MLREIEKEKRIADHLLYVSLKYTRTCDVILNLIARWQTMMELCMIALLEKAKKKKLVRAIPVAPKQRLDILLVIFKKEQIVKEALQLYRFFKRIPHLKQTREQEFRKGVALVVLDEKETRIDIEQLKSWHNVLERFLSFVKAFIK